MQIRLRDCSHFECRLSPRFDPRAGACTRGALTVDLIQERLSKLEAILSAALAN